MLITHSRKRLLLQGRRLFSSQASDQEEIRRQIDPLKGDFQDFLQHVNTYEDSNKDVLNPYFMKQDRLKGFATPEGTDKYYRRSQYDENEDGLEVHPLHFRSPFDSQLKLTTLGYGSYVGEPDDQTDYLMYDALKQSVLSGGINVIDTAPNYRYMKSEHTIGKVLTTLESKYNVTRDQLFVASKAGYVPEDGINMISQRAMIEKLVEDGVP